MTNNIDRPEMIAAHKYLEKAYKELIKLESNLKKEKCTPISSIFFTTIDNILETIQTAQNNIGSFLEKTTKDKLDN